MEQNGGFRSDSDVRQIGRAAYGHGDAQEVVTRWEKKVLPSAPPGAMLRWKRGPSGKHGSKGALILAQGRPQCEGFIVVVRGAPHFQWKADGTKGRTYPAHQRRATSDGAPITTVRMAWDAFIELKQEVVQLEEAAALLAGRSSGAASAPSSVASTTTPSALLTTQLAGLRTRAGVSLGGTTTRHFSPEEKTYGAVIARMESFPLGNTTVAMIANNRQIALRVLADGTRLDLLQPNDYQIIYDELGELANVRFPTKQNDAGLVEKRRICDGTRANLWKAFLNVLDYARREGWLTHEARTIAHEPLAGPQDVVRLSRAETLRLEDFVEEMSRRAQSAIQAGTLPELVADNGRLLTRAYHWPRLMESCGSSDDMIARSDVRVASVGGVPILQIEERVRYYATGLAAYVLLATGLGPRPGELNALCWNSVDLGAGTITWERRTIGRNHEQPGAQRRRTAAGCKGSRGSYVRRRTVRMTDQMCLALRAWRRERAALLLAMGWQIPMAEAGGLVFMSTFGNVMELSRSGRIWHAVERAAGVPITRQHAVRHAIATERSLAEKALIETCRVLGNSPRVLEQCYIDKKDPRPAAEFAEYEEQWREERQHGRHTDVEIDQSDQEGFDSHQEMETA